MIRFSLIVVMLGTLDTSYYIPFLIIGMIIMISGIIIFIIAKTFPSKKWMSKQVSERIQAKQQQKETEHRALYQESAELDNIKSIRIPGFLIVCLALLIVLFSLLLCIVIVLPPATSWEQEVLGLKMRIVLAFALAFALAVILMFAAYRKTRQQQ